MTTPGVGVDQQCKADFQELKLKGKYRYITFILNNDNTAVVVKKTSSSTSYDEFVADLPDTECRFAVYDFKYDVEGGTRKKIVFVDWTPDTARIKEKMQYISAKDAFRKSLDGIQIDIRGTAYDEVSYESVLDRARRQ
ncbi:actin-binding ADF family protein [Nocardia sp. NPDC057272]|uniref:actin-binding ADF family protein n=1 Tax=Nocardia sp. NPDC057272 TaxID=3346079 RepID=UPI00364187DD